MSNIIAPPSNGWGSFASLVRQPSGAETPTTGANVTAGHTEISPRIPDLSLAAFEALTSTTQALYLLRRGNEDGHGIYVLKFTDRSRPANDQEREVRYNNGTLEIRKLPAANGAGWAPGVSSGSTTQNTAVANPTAAEFRSWDRRSQENYLTLARDRNSVVDLPETNGTYTRMTGTSPGGQRKVEYPITQQTVGFQPSPGMTMDLGNGIAVTNAQGVVTYPVGAPDGQVDIPYYHLEGSGTGGTMAPLIRAGAEALFPTLDGATNATSLPAAERPDGFDATPASLNTLEKAEAFVAKYKTWHSSYQAEWIRLNVPTPAQIAAAQSAFDQAEQDAAANNYAPNPSTPNVKPNGVRLTANLIEIPPTTYELKAGTGGVHAVVNPPLISLFLSSPNTDDPYRRDQRPVNIASITKEQLGMLSEADQRLVAQSATFQSVRQADLGLRGIVWSTTTPKTVSGDAAAVQAVADLDNLKKAIDGTWDLVTKTAINPAKPALKDAADRAVFKDQLDILRKQMEASSFMDTAKINAQITEITKRFQRAQNYYFSGYGDGAETTAPITVDGGRTFDVPKRVVSLDGGKTIQSGYDTFIAQEKRLLQYAKDRYDLVTPDTTRDYGGKPFDAPTMIYYLQFKYNLDLEAKVTMETEAVKQLNAYLKDYAEWQDWIQKTMGAFTSTQIKDSHTLGLLYDGGLMNENTRYKLVQAYDPTAKSLNDDKAKRAFRLAMMFEDANAITRTNPDYGYTKHPAEVEKGIERPDGFDIFVQSTNNDLNYDVPLYTQSQWNTYSTRLGDKVSQLNQDSQQKMNDINNMDKQRNRHYDLANSALQKMNDALQSILRATG